MYVLLGSLVAAMCMIIPGVSGSMILMIFGIYSMVISAISNLTKSFLDSFLILVPVGIGVILGIVFGAKLIDLCIKKLPQMTYFAIIGLMLGSPLVIFMKFRSESLAAAEASGVNHFTASPLNLTLSAAAMLIGFAIALFFGSEKLRSKFRRKKQPDPAPKNSAR